MADIRNIAGEVEALARSLEAGTDGLSSMGKAPVANAGESIGILAGAISQLSEASAGVIGGLHQSAEDVRTANAAYQRSDDTAADGMPDGGGN